MSAWVLGVVVAVGLGTTEVDAALTVGGRINTSGDLGDASVSAHARVDVARRIERFFLAGRASLFVAGSWPMPGLGATPPQPLPVLDLQDLGSHLRLGYRPRGAVRQLALEVMPFSSVVRYPAFDWANAWGAGAGFAPLLTLSLATEDTHTWVAARLQQGAVMSGSRVYPSLLAGFEAQLGGGVALELRGALLQPPPGALAATRFAEPLLSGGGGARLSWTWNEPVGPALDLVTYGSDPLRFERFFTMGTPRFANAAWVAVEGGAMAWERAGLTAAGSERLLFPGWWVDAQARVRLGALRLFGTVRGRSFTAEVDELGLFSDGRLPGGELSGPRLVGFLGADYTFRGARLTPGLLASLAQPAHFNALAFAAGNGTNPPPLGGGLTYFPGEGRFSSTPTSTISPLFVVKASLRWELLDFAAVVTELQVEQDFNRPSLGGPLAGFEARPVRVSGQLFLQGRL